MEFKATVMQKLKTAPGGDITISNSVSFDVNEDLSLIDQYDKLLKIGIFDAKGNIKNPGKLLMLATRLAFVTREQQRKMLCELDPQEFILPE